jgi:hypothetical protein
MLESLDRLMNAAHVFAESWNVSLGLTLVGFAFFGALTVQSSLRPNRRVYLPSLLWIDLGYLSRLNATLLFGPARQSRLAAVWHAATALLLVWGFVLFVRVWRQERSRKRGAAVDPNRN